MAKCNKVCLCCGESLPIEQFPTNRRMLDGHLGWCFDCWKMRNTPEGNALANQLRQEAKKREKRAQKKAYQRLYRQRHAEEVKRKNREYYRERIKRDPVRYATILAKNKVYQQSERGRQKQAEATRRYLKRIKQETYAAALH